MSLFIEFDDVLGRVYTANIDQIGLKRHREGTVFVLINGDSIEVSNQTYLDLLEILLSEV